MQNTKLAIILPCYNEELIIDSSYAKIKAKLMRLIESNKISNASRLVFVNDGSKDKTWDKIASIQENDPYIIGIKLSRNFGHQNALIAGLTSQFNKFDCYITIDADLQDDIDAIDGMIDKFDEGFSIVYGVRNDRTNDSYFKRKTAESFYKIMSFLNVKTIFNHADFRLVDNLALTEFMHFQEVNVFLRGIFPLLGFPFTVVYYKRKEREAGETKYPLKKMVAFAWEGVSSLSSKPLRMILHLGLITFTFSILVSAWALVVYIQGKSIPGWFSTVFPISILSGIQMISLGIIGEYVGKIYLEVKHRPRFIIETIAETKQN